MTEISQYEPVFHPSFAEVAAADVGAPMVCGVQRYEITVKTILEQVYFPDFCGPLI